MEQQELKEGQLVQLNPETVANPIFAACIMVVTEPKSFGAQGYVQGISEENNLIKRNIHEHIRKGA